MATGQSDGRGESLVIPRYVGRLEQVSGQSISCYADFVGALEARHDFFAAQGCRLSDHGLSEFYAEDYVENDIKRLFDKVYGGTPLDGAECARFKSAMLVEFARMDAEKDGHNNSITGRYAMPTVG